MNWTAFFVVFGPSVWVFGTVFACVEVEKRFGTEKANMYVALPSLVIGLSTIAGLVTA